MPEHDTQNTPHDEQAPFARYLNQIEDLMGDLSPQTRLDVREELLAHLADAAAERNRSPEDGVFQREVIEEFGPAEALGTALVVAHRDPTELARYSRWKRLMDVALSLAALVMVSPVFLLALLIPLDSPGPIFYTDRRIGKGGRPFTLYKLRTMRSPLAPSSNEPPTDGARVTRIGRWLRRCSLDEVPQLFNVLKGEMSLIGPRPRLVGALAANDTRWRQALTVAPGLSGLEQVTLGHSPSRDVQALGLDLRYVRQRSLSLDLRLLWRALRTSLMANGYTSGPAN